MCIFIWWTLRVKVATNSTFFIIGYTLHWQNNCFEALPACLPSEKTLLETYFCYSILLIAEEGRARHKKIPTCGWYTLRDLTLCKGRRTFSRNILCSSFKGNANPLIMLWERPLLEKKLLQFTIIRHLNINKSLEPPLMLLYISSKESACHFWNGLEQ